MDPVIRESSLEQILKPSPELPIRHQLQRSSRRVISLQNLFDADACGRQVKNVVLYGTVGTGKSTLIKKMVVDWCHGLLPRFELIIPFSCEDLSHSRVPISLRRLVTKKYQHLRDVAPLLGASNLKVLFILNGLERLNLDFRLAGTELCCDPSEPIAPSAIVVNLLRKYLLPEVSGPPSCSSVPQGGWGRARGCFGLGSCANRSLSGLAVSQRAGSIPAGTPRGGFVLICPRGVFGEA